MTEAEWLACEEPGPMLDFLKGKASDRKVRLFSISCCRRIWQFLDSPSSRNVVEVMEQVVEGAALEAHLEAAAEGAKAYRDSARGRRSEIGCGAAFAAASITEDYPGEEEVWSASRTALCTQNCFGWVAYEVCISDQQEERARLAQETADAAEGMVLSHVLRDIIGNPFLPKRLSPRYATADVVRLAAMAYDVRALPSGELDSARLAVLSDALEDAGCTDADILSHLRLPGPHVRGCWALDLLLGKS